MLCVCGHLCLATRYKYSARRCAPSRAPPDRSGDDYTPRMHVCSTYNRYSECTRVAGVFFPADALRLPQAAASHDSARLHVANILQCKNHLEYHVPWEEGARCCHARWRRRTKTQLRYSAFHRVRSSRACSNDFTQTTKIRVIVLLPRLHVNDKDQSNLTSFPPSRKQQRSEQLDLFLAFT